MSNVINAKSTTGHDVPAIVGPDGQLLMLGATPEKPAISVAAPWPKEWVLSRAERKERQFDRRRLDFPLWDQNPMGSCVPHGILRAWMKTMFGQGFACPPLSRGMAYALVNGGRDAGADPAQLVEVLQQTGVCTEATMPYRFYRERDISAKAMEEAKRFRIPEGGVRSCSNWDEMLSAAIFGWDLGVTLRVGNGYTELDSEGCAPAYRGVGNHEQNAGDAFRIDRSGRELLAADQSWGTLMGRHWLCEDHFDDQPQMQVFAFVYAAPDADDPNPIPPAP